MANWNLRWWSVQACWRNAGEFDAHAELRAERPDSARAWCEAGAGARDRRGGTGAQCAAEREENILRERGLRLGLVDLEGGRRRKARAGEEERRSSGAGGWRARCHLEA